VHLQCCAEFKIFAETSGQSSDRLDQSESTPSIRPDTRISIVHITNPNAVVTDRVPDMQFHSLHVGKSYANPVTKPKSNLNPNTNTNLNPHLTNPTKCYTNRKRNSRTIKYSLLFEE